MIHNEIKKRFILRYIKEAEKVKKNQRLNKKNEEIAKDGYPWTIIAHFPTYNEAAKKVDEEKEPNSDYDYKIKRFESDFRVKKRLRSGLAEKKKNKKK